MLCPTASLPELTLPRQERGRERERGRGGDMRNIARDQLSGPFVRPCCRADLAAALWSGTSSAVHAVADAVNEVSLVRRQHHEVALVLFDDGLDVVREVRDVVDVPH